MVQGLPTSWAEPFLESRFSRKVFLPQASFLPLLLQVSGRLSQKVLPAFSRFLCSKSNPTVASSWCTDVSVCLPSYPKFLNLQ